MSESDDDYGPALPPGFTTSGNECGNIGPQAMPTIRKEDICGGLEKEEMPDTIVVNDDEDSDDDVIGPVLPSDAANNRNYGVYLPTDSGNKNGREEWMTVIPEKVEKKLGFGKSVTTFSKASAEPIKEAKTVSKKDQDIAAALEDYSKKKRPASLLNLHEDKLKKDKGLKTDKKERKPLDFNIEDDLTFKQFDERQKKSVIDKSKLLNTRFSSGSSAKFL